MVGEAMEAIGDADAVYSTRLGIKNIRRIVPMLIPAAVQEGEDFADLRELYDRLIGQWTTELQHVAGIVGSVEGQEKYGGRANFIRILHDDGTMALYAHLRSEGALVRVGQRVRAGQQIGLSGNTGFTTGPHLHFVIQVNRGMKLESLPFRMRGPNGPLRIAGGPGGSR